MLEVREYDRIYCGTGESTSKVHYLDQKHFDQLRDCVASLARNEDGKEFFRFGYSRLGPTITVQNYVGLIRLLDGFQVQIIPKIDMDEGATSPTKARDILLNMISTIMNPSPKAYEAADTSTQKVDVFEYLISLFVDVVDDLIRDGLKSQYNTVEENTTTFKGRLMVNENIRHNMAHRECFYVSHDEYTRDRPENRLLKSTLTSLRTKSGHYQNKRRINRVLEYFDGIPQSHNYQADFARVFISRENRDYEMPLKWARVFLNQESFTVFAGDEEVTAFLFSMHDLYEQYMAQVAKNTFAPQGWTVTAQDRRYYLFNDPKKTFQLIPDIVMRKGKQIIIMDTKWKRLNHDVRNYGISRSDMYQMYAYSKKYNVPDIYVLYPYVCGFDRKEDYVFSGNDEVRIHVVFVDMTRTGEVLKGIAGNRYGN